MKEIWKWVVDSTSYKVSNLGRVRREVSGQGTWAGRVLEPKLGAMHGKKNFGYFRVVVELEGKRKWKLVHVLVAEAFIGPCPAGKEVNHKDGVKSNCRWDNLEYKTSSQNSKHAYDNGLRVAHPSPGSKNGMAKVTEKQVIEIRRLWETGKYTQDSLGRKFGISQTSVWQITSGKNWRRAA